jgi:hypothetical protein
MTDADNGNTRKISKYLQESQGAVKNSVAKKLSPFYTIPSGTLQNLTRPSQVLLSLQQAVPT